MKNNFGLSRTELLGLIDEWIFNERNRAIVARAWIDGITYERLAEEFDLSVRQIKNIVYQAKKEVCLRIGAQQ